MYKIIILSILLLRSMLQTEVTMWILQTTFLMENGNF